MFVRSIPFGFLIWTLALATVVVSCSATSAPEQVRGRDALENKGYVDVTRFIGVDPDGKSDSTKGLIEAINYAAKHSLVAFFPTGTYLVSNTIRAEQLLRHRRKCGRKRNSVVMVGSTVGSRRPLIRLAEASPGFNDPNQPKPVVHILTPRDGGGEHSACSFAQAFRGIDISVGARNPGAVGIRFSAAQESSFENVSIDATGGYAGVSAVPGRGMASVNIEVLGGKYGIDLQQSSGSLGASLVGVVLRGQTDLAIRSSIRNALAVTGFVIEKEEGPVIQTQSGHAQVGNMVLIDGRIEIKKPSLVIDNRMEVFVQLNQVFVSGASELVRSGAQRSVKPVDKGWTVVRQYSYCPKKARGDISSWNLINGKRNQEEIVSLFPSPGPPADLVERHIPYGIASFEDEDVVDAKALGVKGDGATDDTKALQNAIDRHEKVFLPRGKYLISDTIRLKKTTQLFGVPGLRSQLIPKRSWKPDRPTWMIETVNDADATTVLAEVCINPPAERSWLGSIRWRAGRQSIVRSVPRETAVKTDMSLPRHIYKIAGHGGGRWYRWESIAGFGVQKKRGSHQHGRKLLIDGTSEPLTFYGFNPEHSWVPMVELLRAKNVRIFGTKSEHDAAPVLLIRDSSNVFAAVFTGKRHRAGRPPFIIVEDGTDIEISGVVRQGANEPMLVDNKSKTSIAADEYLALYRRGEVDHRVWSHSGRAAAYPIDQQNKNDL